MDSDEEFEGIASKDVPKDEQSVERGITTIEENVVPRLIKYVKDELIRV
jgi:hypothetical protein